MYIPFVFEHILYTVDKYFSQLVAFCTNNFSFDAYGMFLSVYFRTASLILELTAWTLTVPVTSPFTSAQLKLRV